MKLAASLLACAVLITGVVDASAARRDKDKAKTVSSKPALVAAYGDWKVYQTASGKSKICYLLSEPKSRAPDEQAKAYAFISERPAEHVRNEISFVMGFDVAAGGDVKQHKEVKERKHERRGRKHEAEAAVGPTVTVGDASFDLAPKGSDLWIKNPAEEGKVIDEMRKGSSLVIKAASKKGHKTTDTYSLSGFTQAIDRALKDCPGG